MFLIVGLGNPGEQYCKNRHNLGFMTIDAVAARHSFPQHRFQSKFGGHVSIGAVYGTKCILFKPSSFMNRSGIAVGAVLNFYNVDPKNSIVAYDELDLPLAKIKLTIGGGSAGHKGIESLQKDVFNNAVRLRVGIGHPGDKNRVLGHVLGNFSHREQIHVRSALDAIAENLQFVLEGSHAHFLQCVSSSVK